MSGEKRQINQGADMVDLQSLLAGCSVGVVGAALAFWKKTDVDAATREGALKIFAEQLKAVKDNGSQTDEEFKRTLKETITELKATALALAQMQAGQTLHNQFVKESLQGITARQDRTEADCKAFDHRLNDIAATLSVARDIAALYKQQVELLDSFKRQLEKRIP